VTTRLTREAADPALGPPKLLTRRQAADLLSLGTTTVDELIGSGQLASLKIGKARRVLATSIDDFIQRNAEGADDTPLAALARRPRRRAS
jgi:excisionase family DNA binding protein